MPRGWRRSASLDTAWAASVDGPGVRGEPVLIGWNRQVLGGDAGRRPVELLLVVEGVGIVLERGRRIGRPAAADPLLTGLNRNVGFGDRARRRCIQCILRRLAGPADAFLPGRALTAAGDPVRLHRRPRTSDGGAGLTRATDRGVARVHGTHPEAGALLLALGPRSEALCTPGTLFDLPGVTVEHQAALRGAEVATGGIGVPRREALFGDLERLHGLTRFHQLGWRLTGRGAPDRTGDQRHHRPAPLSPPHRTPPAGRDAAPGGARCREDDQRCPAH